MIINEFRYGQLGNRLFLTSQLIVLAADTDSTLIDYSFDTYKQYFKNLYDKDFIIYPETKRNKVLEFVFKKLQPKVSHLHDFLIYRKLQSRFLTCINQHETSITNYDDYLHGIKKYNNVLIQGWIKNDITPLYKYRKQLTHLFQPLDVHIDNINNLISSARSSADVLIGVHIRRGDYKEFRGGIYFFDDNVYVSLMKNMQANFPGKKVRFLICSNEKIDFEQYKELDLVKSTNHIVEDMYALSHCDYIVGPVSSYSLWAAFIGEKPLYRMLDRNMPFDPNHFIYINDRSVHE